MTNNWINQAHFYHIYPLGFCGAEKNNDFHSPPQNRLNQITQWIPQMKQLGINALYLGPVFESTSHGYDTADFFWPDRRLGSKEDLKALCQGLKQAEIRIVLDGVFNHVGRDFWAFRDLQKTNKTLLIKNGLMGSIFQKIHPKTTAFPMKTGKVTGNW